MEEAKVSSPADNGWLGEIRDRLKSDKDAVESMRIALLYLM